MSRDEAMEFLTGVFIKAMARVTIRAGQPYRVERQGERVLKVVRPSGLVDVYCVSGELLDRLASSEGYDPTIIEQLVMESKKFCIDRSNPADIQS